jgi:hypothetical protein
MLVLAIALAIPSGMALAQASYKLWTDQYLFPYGSPPFEVMRAYVAFFLQNFEAISPKQFNELHPAIQFLLVFIPNLVAVLLGIWSLLRLLAPSRSKRGSVSS